MFTPFASTSLDEGNPLVLRGKPVNPVFVEYVKMNNRSVEQERTE